jgi:anthranilate/para-aminobenzoate synthase component I
MDLQERMDHLVHLVSQVKAVAREQMDLQETMVPLELQV